VLQVATICSCCLILEVPDEPTDPADYPTLSLAPLFVSQVSPCIQLQAPGGYVGESVDRSMHAMLAKIRYSNFTHTHTGT